MPSPFPGMDPYLEDPAFWPDVHGTLVTSIRAAITKQLPPDFFAELDQHVWLEEEDPVRRERRGRPDVYITSGGGRGRRTKSSNGRPLIAEPTATVKLPTLEKITGPRFIRIVSMRERRVVTAIELLSPPNKKVGTDHTAYLVKRNEYLSTGTNLVEVDLLRAGTRLPVGSDKLPDTDYYAYVTRGPEYSETDVWAFTVRDPFPVFPIPLTPHRAELSLDLKPCLDRAYDEANYGPQIDYSAPPVPPLRKPDAEWAAEVLKKHAKKTKK
jgi:hypothetical protein